jgi:hypothetical protein
MCFSEKPATFQWKIEGKAFHGMTSKTVWIEADPRYQFLNTITTGRSPRRQFQLSS